MFVARMRKGRQLLRDPGPIFLRERLAHQSSRVASSWRLAGIQPPGGFSSFRVTFAAACAALAASFRSWERTGCLTRFRVPKAALLI